MTQIPMANSPAPLSESVFLTLVALADQPRHGYAVLREVERWTGGRVVLRTATLYTALARLVDDGLVVETAGDPDADGRRRVYTLTEDGRRTLAAEAARLRANVELAERVAADVVGP